MDEDFAAPDRRLAVHSDDEFEYEEGHNKLVDAIRSMDGKRKTVRQRTELRNEIATANVGKGVISMDELGLGSNHSKQLNRVTKTQKVEETPLHKHEQQKVVRDVLYTEMKKEVSKWDPVVEKNRKEDTLDFPLQKPDVRLITLDKFVKRDKPRTNLEIAVAKALGKPLEEDLAARATLTKAEQRALRAMDLEAAKERRDQMHKYRAYMNKKEAKARWQKKIKSKRYHRMMRLEKQKQEKLMLEELQKRDPEAFLEKMMPKDRDRIQERATLKHRGASKRMKKAAIYGKFDDAAREMVQQMNQKSRELTEKIPIVEESEESASEEEVEGVARPSANAWLGVIPDRCIPDTEEKPKEEVQQEVSEEEQEGEEAMEEAEEEPEEADSDEEEIMKTFKKEFSPPQTRANKRKKDEEEAEEQERNKRKKEEEVEKRESTPRKVKAAVKPTETPKSQKKAPKDTEKQAETPSKKSKAAVKQTETPKSQKKALKVTEKQVETPSKKRKKTEDSDVEEKEDQEVKRKKDEKDSPKTPKTPEVKEDKKQEENGNDFQVVESKKKRKRKKKKNNQGNANDDNFDIDAVFDKLKEKRLTIRQEKKANKKKAKKGDNRPARKPDSSSDSESDDHSDHAQDSSDDDEELVSASTSRKRTLEDFSNLPETQQEKEQQQKKLAEATLSKTQPKPKSREDIIKPIKPMLSKVVTIKHDLTTDIGAMVADEDDDDSELRMTIKDAFSDRDVVNEFREEKKRIVEGQKPKDIDMFMPGWGNWGGPGIQPSKRLKKKFTIKAPAGPKRKDAGLTEVIINEVKDTTIAKHQVSELPRGYKNIHTFEAKLAQPIGRDWNSELAYRNNIKPKVKTMQGTVIEPINKEDTFKHVGVKKKADINFSSQPQKGQKGQKQNTKGGNKQNGKKK